MDTGSLKWILLLLVTICSNSVQKPTFFKSTFKGLNGVVPWYKLARNGIRAVYYNDQTVAIVDLDNNNELQDCNVIEVYEEYEAEEVLRNLSTTATPQLVSFQEMTNLMQQCELLDRIKYDHLHTSTESTATTGSRGVSNVLALLSGILPGTKWCGAGDVAQDYHDLGQDVEIDRCCRNHDLCPVKVRARQTRYNLTNYSMYTKSHCACDETLYNCLKASMHPMAQVIGEIYFNVIKVPCIEDVPQDKSTSVGITRQFIHRIPIQFISSAFKNIAG